ncbi:hypothetical protein [Lentibacillus jeotgali]|uniref:hypothetical protein n=1 Tax=Lentibacillus jeotgali TaxID=558169 RepID=UPI00110FB2D5|nr:hypothetical protein [Lentibacillus jeotgali]
MREFFSLFKSFSLFNLLRENFALMNLFDILIGNQDRHAHNWKVLYINQKPTFGPLYDNGASLGWQLPEEQIQQQLHSVQKMNTFFKKSRVKMGMDNKESPRIKAKQVLYYLSINYPNETRLFYNKLPDFNLDTLEEYLKPFPLLTKTRKQFIIEMIRFRRMKMLEILKEGGTANEQY